MDIFHTVESETIPWVGHITNQNRKNRYTIVPVIRSVHLDSDQIFLFLWKKFLENLDPESFRHKS